MEEIKNKPKKPKKPKEFEELDFYDEIEKISSRNWSSLDKMVAEFLDLKEKFKDN